MRTNHVKDLDDRIDILDRNANEALPTKPMFEATSAILALVRVSIFTLCSSVLRISRVC